MNTKLLSTRCAISLHNNGIGGHESEKHLAERIAAISGCDRMASVLIFVQERLGCESLQPCLDAIDKTLALIKVEPATLRSTRCAISLHNNGIGGHESEKHLAERIAAISGCDKMASVLIFVQERLGCESFQPCLDAIGKTIALIKVEPAMLRQS